MVMIWHETTDDEVEPPEGMAVASATVRRRSWESECGHRRFELTAYLGVDVMGFVVVSWDCRIWRYGKATEYMSSEVAIYRHPPRPGRQLRRLAQAILPVEVSRYAMWGHLLSATTNQG